MAQHGQDTRTAMRTARERQPPALDLPKLRYCSPAADCRCSVTVMEGTGKAFRGATLAFALTAACGGSLTRTQAEAQRAGVAYLEATAREAAAAAGVEYMGCDRGAARTSGSADSYTVEACGSRVGVHCVWSGGGGPSCLPEPEREAAARARDERAEHARAETARRAPPPRAPSRPARVAVSEGAAFRVDDTGVLCLDALSGYVELHARASRAHPSRVLISFIINHGDSAACDHHLTLTAAGEQLEFEADRRDGATSHYLLDADLVATLIDRLPLRATVCGQSLPFGHPALRALRSFIEADAAMRASTP